MGEIKTVYEVCPPKAWPESLPKVGQNYIFIYGDDDIRKVGGHYEEEPCGCGEKGLGVVSYCPVDLIVTDPDGLAVSPELSEIPDAMYACLDLDEKEGIDSAVLIPERKNGEYLIKVLPKSESSLSDTYTLEVTSGDKSIVLAEDVKVSDIPDKPYVIKSSESGIDVDEISTSGDNGEGSISGDGGEINISGDFAVLSPNGGEVLDGLRYYTITWTALDNVTRIDLSVSVDGGKRWREIVRKQANTGSYNWMAPNMNINNCLIRIDAYYASGKKMTDTSDASFTVKRRPGGWFGCQ